MLKDLLNSLQQGSNQIQSRMYDYQASLDQYGRSQAIGMGGAGPSNKGAGGPVGNSDLPAGKLGALLQAVREQESGGRYGIQNGIGAAGAYQIMPSNFVGPGGWDKTALGRDVSLKFFLNHPKTQDAIAKNILGGYYKRHGAAGAAKSWYAGEGNANTNSNASQYGGPSINAYAAQVLSKMKKYM